MITDYYRILGINHKSSIDEIKNAYRKLSKKFHPDVNQGDKFFEERFKEIQEAYEKLNDPKFKNAYDKHFEEYEETYNSNSGTSSDYNTQSQSSQKSKSTSYSFYGKKINSDLIIKILIPVFIAILIGGLRSYINKSSIENAKEKYNNIFKEKINNSQNLSGNKPVDRKSVKINAANNSQNINQTNPLIILKEESPLMKLPLSLVIGKSTEEEIMEKGLVRDDDWGEGRSEILYMSSIKNVYCYVNKKTLKLCMLKIWQTSQEWKEFGIATKMSQGELLSTFKRNSIGYLQKSNDYDNNIFVNKFGLQYWFCFPKSTDESNNQYSDKLQFVVVKPYDYKPIH